MFPGNTVEWKRGQYQVALVRETETCCMIAKLNDNYSIHCFGSGTGDDSVGAGSLEGTGDHIHLQCASANQVLLCTYIDVYRSAQCRSPPLRRLHSLLQKKHETIGDKLAFQPDIFDMIFASRLVSLLFVSFLPPTPVDFVRFELLLLRMQRSLPQAPRRCEEDASEELFSKSSSSSEGET